jgi:hypothetical protein
MILDLGIEALQKFEHNVCPLEVSSTIDQFLEVINIFINNSTVLEESQYLQFGPRCLYFVLWAEVCHEIFYKLPPCKCVVGYA